MSFPAGRKVYRLRARPVLDPYSKKPISADWDDPFVLEIPDAFVAQTSTSMLAGTSREQAAVSKSLFCDGSLDIQKGDRIRDGEPGAPVYTIDGIPPTADTHPWTGWTPPREIPLTRYVG